MLITRRNLLRNIAAGAAATAFPSLTFASSDSKREGPLRLSRNENPYGPSAKVLAAMQDATLHAAGHYPEAEAQTLRTKIASVHSISPEQVVLGCGSTEIMRMAVDAFAGPQRRVVVAVPTCDLVGKFAVRAGAKVIAVPLARNYAHDLRAMRAQIDAATRLVYICNPNNPTGRITPRKDIEAFIRSLPAAAHVLIDEAYHHYVSQSADYVSFIDRPMDHPRVIVIRTFSKIHGLAGLRVGYAIAAARPARLLAAHALPQEVSVVAAKAAVAALEDTGHVAAAAGRNADDRQEFLNQANARMVRTIDSQTNFVMIHAGSAIMEVIETFKKNNIALPDPYPSFREHIRVSLGTPAEMTEFWRVWDLMPHKMAM